jgi:hypothetical protein
MVAGELSDTKKVGRKALEERMARKQELSDIGRIMSEKEGRRFMWRLLKKGRILESCFTGNNTTFYNEGRRDVAAEFLADTQRFPELYLDMVRENQPSEELPKVRDEEEATTS